MSVVEEQAKELGVDAAGGAKDGGQERDTMIVRVEGGGGTFITGAVDLLKRHSGIVWDPGRGRYYTALGTV